MHLSNILLFILPLLLSPYLAFANYNPAEGVEYAYASALAHCPPKIVLSWTCGAACKNLTGYHPFYSEQLDITYNETLSFAMIYNPSSKKFITTFRGTVGTVELIMEIIQGNALPYGLSDIPNALVDNYFYSHYVNYLRPIVTSKLQEAHDKYPDYEYIFTGHSLGAALTTFAAFDAVTSGILSSKQTILYNYGSPRVGNYIFAEAVEAAIPVIYRVTHWRDIVPHVPLCKGQLLGKCKKGDLYTEEIVYNWPAWHLTHEVFYNEANTEYVECNGGEDPTCADQFSVFQLSKNDHFHYANVHMGCDPVKQEISY